MFILVITTLVPDSVPVLLALVPDVHLFAMNLIDLLPDDHNALVLLLDLPLHGVRWFQLLQAVLKRLHEIRSRV